MYRNKVGRFVPICGRVMTHGSCYTLLRPPNGSHKKHLRKFEKWTSVSPYHATDARLRTARPARGGQRLTLVHFSAQLKPCLKQESTLHTQNTP